MRCKTVNNDYGQLICFIDPRFEEIDLKKCIEESNAVYTHLVFFEEEIALSFYELISEFEFIGDIHINLVGCGTVKVIDTITTMQLERIKTISVSVDSFYSALQFNDVWIGSEIWLYDKSPLMVKNIDTTDGINRYISHVERIIDDMCCCDYQNDLEKIISLDIWIQQHIQYICDTETETQNGTYVSKSITDQPNYKDFLLDHFGSCEDIAFVSSLVLNNPRVGIRCRCIGVHDKETGLNHAWNIVECDGKEYVTDFTHNITRSPTVSKSALMTTEYHDTFTLIGFDSFDGKYKYLSPYPNERISSIAFDREKMRLTLDRLKQRGVPLKWKVVPNVPTEFFCKECCN